MPIVEGAVLLGTAAVVILGPVKKWLTAGRILKKMVNDPVRKIELPNGKIVEVDLHEFTDDQGRQVVDFAFHVVMDDGKKVPIVITRAETELLQQASFFEALIKGDSSPTREQMQRLVDIINLKGKEIRRNRKRRVRVLKE
jgi:hypothetical protein